MGRFGRRVSTVTTEFVQSHTPIFITVRIFIFVKFRFHRKLNDSLLPFHFHDAELNIKHRAGESIQKAKANYGKYSENFRNGKALH